LADVETRAVQFHFNVWTSRELRGIILQYALSLANAAAEAGVLRIHKAFPKSTGQLRVYSSMFGDRLVLPAARDRR
jgi:hypothetical protein